MKSYAIKKKKKDQVINVITESNCNIKMTNKYHISNLFINYAQNGC